MGRVAVILLAAVVLVAAAEAQRTTTLEPLLFDNSFSILYDSEAHIERTFDGRAVSLSMTEASGTASHFSSPSGLVSSLETLAFGCWADCARLSLCAFNVRVEKPMKACQ